MNGPYWHVIVKQLLDDDDQRTRLLCTKLQDAQRRIFLLRCFLIDPCSAQYIFLILDFATRLYDVELDRVFGDWHSSTIFDCHPASPPGQLPLLSLSLSHVTLIDDVIDDITCRDLV